MIALRFTLGGRNNKPIVAIAHAKRKIDQWLRQNEWTPEHMCWFDEEGHVFDSTGDCAHDRGGDRTTPNKADVILW